MKPLDLREFAEQLRLDGSEWADEILELFDEAERTEDYDEILECLQKLVPEKLHKKEIWRQFEFIEDRLDLLVETENLLPDYADRLKIAGIETKGRAIDDIMGDLLERLPVEWDL